MIKRCLAAVAILLFCLSAAPVCAAASNVPLRGNAEIALHQISTETYLRSIGDTASLSDLESNEFYSFTLILENTGKTAYTASSLSVSVDGGEKWYWQGMTFQPGVKTRFHIYHVNMKKCMTEGNHTVRWYVNDQLIHQESFRFTRQSAAAQAPSLSNDVIAWSSVFPLPSQKDIQAANASAVVRSPYLAGTLNMDWNYRFTEYSVDFKADMLPKATYCCLANMQMDLSPLKAKYSNVRTEYEGVNMYAGFQRRLSDKVSIISFWDIYFDDASGRTHTIRARRTYPEKSVGGDDFGGEGTGAHTLVPYDWQEDRWYRMLLQCSTSESNGHTLVDQWVCDLTTGQWTRLCQYDIGFSGSCFTGPVSFFLENFDNKHAGEIRTMEVANIRLKNAATGKWINFSSAYLASANGLPQYEGSYAYGAQGNRFWMITSGVGGDWFGTSKVPENYKTYYVTPTETGDPY